MMKSTCGTEAFMSASSGLNYLFELPRPHGLGYEIWAFQAIYKET